MIFQGEHWNGTMLTPPSRESFNSLAAWLTDCRALASPDIVIVLVGNKKDLEVQITPVYCLSTLLSSGISLLRFSLLLTDHKSEREVSFIEASRFAQDNGGCMGPRGGGVVRVGDMFSCRSLLLFLLFLSSRSSK